MRWARSQCILTSVILSCLGGLIYTHLFVYDDSVTHVVNYGQYVFREYHASGVFSLRDICIEDHPMKPGEKVLVAYNSDHESAEEELVRDYHSENSKYPGWPVFHRKGRIPLQHGIMDHPAYFMVATCGGNFHHIIDDSLLGLYGLLQATGRLGQPKSCQLFSTSCRNVTVSSCHSYSRYRDLVLALGVVPDTYGCLNDFPHRDVCYRHAGFGFKNADKKQFYRFVTKQFGLTEESCSGPGILLLERKNRRVLNMAELEQATRALLPNTHVERIDFEDLSLEKQMKRAFCSHILVGVQGAGLQWVYFMPDHSAILEIVWERWPAKYVYRGSTVGVKGQVLEVTENITINWPLYLERSYTYKGQNLTEEQRREILANTRLTKDNNPYKFADVRIGVDVYLEHLKALVDKLRRDGVEWSSEKK